MQYASGFEHGFPFDPHLHVMDAAQQAMIAPPGIHPGAVKMPDATSPAAQLQTQRAVAWAQRSGQFTPDQLSQFFELARMLQAKAVDISHVIGDRKLDEGSFGTIETAFYFGSKVAIKYLKIEAAQGNMHISLPQALHQLRLELSIVQTLRHPNIVDFIGAVVSFPDVSKCGGTTNEDWSIGTMYEFCEGGQLNRLLHKTRVKLSTAQKMKLLTDLANGLSYLHANRIIHRDLGSRNVLISNGMAKICDFGCARKMTQNLLQTTTISGSPPWMSPEQVNGKELSLFSDVFSFGTIMWEVLMQTIPHGHIEAGAPLEAYSFAISHGLQPKGPTMQDLRDCSAEQVHDINDLLELLHEHVPDVRPTAEQLRKVLTSITRKLSPKIALPVDEDVPLLVQQLQDRRSLGLKMIEFYSKYNPVKLKDLSAVLKNFEGKQDELNLQMRLRYKADLYGEYPDCPLCGEGVFPEHQSLMDEVGSLYHEACALEAARRAEEARLAEEQACLEAADSASIKTAIQQANESANSEAGQDSAMMLTTE